MNKVGENSESNIFSRPVGLVRYDSDSNLTDLIIDLEHLRRRRYGGTTPYDVFIEMKSIFHLLESLGSARLEGNRTALAELIDENISLKPKSKVDEKHLEVRNTEDALKYIDDYIESGKKIDGSFIREVHKLIVKDLTPQSKEHPEAEGDPAPGQYRQGPVKITGSKLKPPSSGTMVASDMASLIEFIQSNTPPKYDLIKTAITHHRFAAIHPFNNGNGRTVRALTYAMLLEQGFSVGAAGRILNPTAIFCNDRRAYISHLEIADRGADKDLIGWSEYVIAGLREEIGKIDRLTDYQYVRDNIILPAVSDALERKSISAEQATVLRVAAMNKSAGPIKSQDLVLAFPGYSALKRSRLLTRMVELKLLKPIRSNARRYFISFANSYLLRDVIEQLRKLDFIPESMD